MLLPCSKNEIKKLDWGQLDIILVTGDAYIDSPYMGISVIGRLLLNAGYKVAVISQPDINSKNDITRLGEPKLFWGVSSGSIDSMVANYTAIGKPRKKDDFTPGGLNNKRPDRAVIVYSNLIRRFFKKTCPIVLGGIEASLRRICHYDFWSDKLRRSILLDSKADYLVYGMAEKSILQLAGALKGGRDKIKNVKGLCYLTNQKPDNFLELPGFSEITRDKSLFIKMFHDFYHNNDPLRGQGLCQRYDNRYWVQNPPPEILNQRELDEVFSMDFSHDLHPLEKKKGKVKALDTIRFSITTHRGCYGECNYCAIAVHQGRTVSWRSYDSIIKEAEKFSLHPDFKGNIYDVGGPTGNMYGFECQKKLKQGSCRKRRCLFPEKCNKLPVNHQPQIDVLAGIRKIKGVKKVFMASGLRYDLVLADHKKGDLYLRQIIKEHLSGQMKIAPEHSEKSVLEKMGKPTIKGLLQFKKKFDKLTRAAQKKQFLTYYLIAAHPGCTMEHMKGLKKFALQKLHISPRQIQIFTPTPSTYSTLMYYTGIDPFREEKIFVAKKVKERQSQKDLLTGSKK
jgi:uncharacterized radical SAM protein YgiQ